MNTLLRTAVITGNCSAVSALLKRGFDVDEKDKNGHTALMLAAKNGFISICYMLVDAGANPNLTDSSGNTALAFAIESNHFEVVNYLNEVTISDDENCDVGLDSFFDDEWHEETISQPHEQDKSLVAKIDNLMSSIANFTPILSYDDWSDVELPHQDEVFGTKDYEILDLEEDEIEFIKTIISNAIISGFCDVYQIEKFFELHPLKDYLINCFTNVLEDYNIIIINDIIDEYKVIFWCTRNGEDAENVRIDEIYNDFLYAYTDDKASSKFLYHAEKVKSESLNVYFEERNNHIHNILLLLSTMPLYLYDYIKGFAATNNEDVFEDVFGECDKNNFDEDFINNNYNCDNVIMLIDKLRSCIKNDEPVFNDRDIFQLLDFIKYDMDKILKLSNIVLHRFEKSKFSNSSESRRYIDALAYAINNFIHSRNTVIKYTIGFVSNIANRYKGFGCDFMDLFQEGCFGLIKAFTGFDTNNGASFYTYASWWIRSIIYRYIQNNFNTIRIPINLLDGVLNGHFNSQCDETCDDDSPPWIEYPKLINRIVFDRENISLPITRIRLDMIDVLKQESYLNEANRFYACNNQENNIFQLSLKEVISNVMSTLKEKEQKVIAMRFGIGFNKDYTLEEIGKNLGVTRERIRQIESKAMRKLKHRITNLGIRDYLYE